MAGGQELGGKEDLKSKTRVGEGCLEEQERGQDERELGS